MKRDTIRDFLRHERALFIRRDDLQGDWEVGFQTTDGKEEIAHAGEDPVDVAAVCADILGMDEMK